MPRWGGEAMTERVVSAGHKWSMLTVACYKRLLQSKLGVDARLRLLEELNEIPDFHFTPEMLAAIAPMGNIEMQIVEEAMTLDGDERCNASFRVLTSPCVFAIFRQLNPSYSAAMIGRAMADGDLLRRRGPRWCAGRQ
jgi:hypothetical protein